MTAKPKMLGSEDDDYLLHKGFSEETLVKRRVKKIVEKVFSDYEHPSTWWAPSNSASCDKPRNKGGSCADVFISSLSANPLLKNHLDDFEIAIVRGRGVWEKYILVPALCIVDLTLDPYCRAYPVALCEPLKVRVITCESAMFTYALKGAQMQLWKSLKRFPWFRLTGRPCEASDIPRLEEGKKWCSVDYSAATDNLSNRLTTLVVKYISRICDLPYDFCLESLSGHRIIGERSKTGRVYEGYEQTNGQLMGSILSFIVLCIANATVLSLSLDPHEVNFDREILINGDDGLFVADENEKSLWEYISSGVGLAPSLGKVYYSDKFCVINSMLFMQTKNGPQFVPFGNRSGLTVYDARSGKSLKEYTSLGASYKDFVQGHLKPCLRKRAHDLWFKTFRPWLMSREMKNFSVGWYIPTQFGGLGLPLPEDGSLNNDYVGPRQLARIRDIIYRSEKEGVVTPYYFDIKGVSYDCPSRSEEIICGEYKGRMIQYLSEEVLGFSKRTQIVNKPKMDVETVEDIIRKRQGASATPGFMAKCFLEKGDFTEVALELKEKPKDQVLFTWIKWNEEICLREKITLEQVNRFSFDFSESPFTWTPIIPQCKRLPQFKPYRAWLEMLIIERSAVQLLCNSSSHCGEYISRSELYY
jgi:hypothetical protein